MIFDWNLGLTIHGDKDDVKDAKIEIVELFTKLYGEDNVHCSDIYKNNRYGNWMIRVYITIPKKTKAVDSITEFINAEARQR